MYCYHHLLHLVFRLFEQCNNFDKCLEIIESIFNSYKLLIVENKNNNSYLINKFEELIYNIIKVTQYITFNKEQYRYYYHQIN